MYKPAAYMRGGWASIGLYSEGIGYGCTASTPFNPFQSPTTDIHVTYTNCYHKTAIISIILMTVVTVFTVVHAALVPLHIS